jgi:hypothetical protein
MIFPKIDKMPSRDMRQLCPTAQESLKKVLAECVKRGIRIFLTQTYRTNAYQAQLYKEKNGKGAAPPGKSMHEFRVAVDIACKGKDLYHEPTLKAAASVFKAHGWTWGGDLSIDDKPHFQFIPYAEQDKIRALRTPDKIEAYLKVRKK